MSKHSEILVIRLTPEQKAALERAAEDDRPPPQVQRSGDDMLFLYTGGTTGMPKGAMWRQDDLFHRFVGGLPGTTVPVDMAAFVTSTPRSTRLVAAGSWASF